MTESRLPENEPDRDKNLDPTGDDAAHPDGIVPEPEGLRQPADEPHDGQADPAQPALLDRRRLLAGGLLLGAYVLGEISPIRRLFGASAEDDKPRWLTAESPDITVPWMPDTITHWQELIGEMALKYDVDPNMTGIVMCLESGGFSRAYSGDDAKAMGLMQVTPDTAKDIAAKWLKQRVPEGSYDIWDPRTNIEFGTALLARLRDEFAVGVDKYGVEATSELVAAGYNGGPGAANRLFTGKGLQSDQTRFYAYNAMNMWRERRSPESPTLERWLRNSGQRLIDQARAEQGN